MSKTVIQGMNDNTKKFVEYFDELKANKTTHYTNEQINTLHMLYYGLPFKASGCASCNSNVLRTLHMNYTKLKPMYAEFEKKAESIRIERELADKFEEYEISDTTEDEMYKALIKEQKIQEDAELSMNLIDEIETERPKKRKSKKQTNGTSEEI